MILVQLAAADIIVIGAVISPELWSYNSKSWRFGLAGCKAYKGIDTFASTASLYLVATIAFHSLATLNLEEKEVLRRIKRNNDVEDEEVRSSRHSLVANSDSSTPPRSMHVDYRLVAEPRVPVAPPTLYVWALAASLSVPQFALSTIRQEDCIISCMLIDSSHRINIYTLLAVFSLLLPALIYSAIIVLAIAKFKSVKRLKEINSGDTVAVVKLSLWLIAVSIVFSAPRSVFSIYRVYTAGIEDPMRPSTLISALHLFFSSAYLISTILRPILCLMLLPRLRRILFSGARTLEVVVI